MSKDFPSDKSAHVMNVLGNSLRLEILRLLQDVPQSFSEILKHWPDQNSSKLSFHLNKMDLLITKRELDGLYELTELGQSAFNLALAFETDYQRINRIDEQKIEKSKDSELKNLNPASIIIVFSIIFPALLFIMTIPISLFFSIITMIFPLLILNESNGAGVLLPFIGLPFYFFLANRLEMNYYDTVFGGFVFLSIFLFIKIPLMVGTPYILLSVVISYNVSVASLALDLLVIIFINYLLFLIIAVISFYLVKIFGWEWPESPINDTMAFIEKKWFEITNTKILLLLVFCTSFLCILCTTLPVGDIYFSWNSNSDYVGNDVFLSLYWTFDHLLPSFTPALIAVFVNNKLKEIEYFPRKLRLSILILMIISVPLINHFYAFLFLLFLFSRNQSITSTSTVPGFENATELLLFSHIISISLLILGVLSFYFMIGELYERGSLYHPKKRIKTLD